MKNIIFILLIAFIYPSYLEVESQISSNIDYVSTDINDNSGISFAYNHNIVKSGYFSLYAGISYTASPLKFENSNLYSLDSDLGIITQCNDIVDPVDTEVNIGYIFIKPQYKTSDKFSLWFSLGINIFDVNYLQITHPYQEYNFVCDNCDDDNVTSHNLDLLNEDSLKRRLTKSLLLQIQTDLSNVKRVNINEYLNELEVM